MSVFGGGRFEQVAGGVTSGLLFLAFALRSVTDGRLWEAAGFAAFACLWVLGPIVGRRPANRRFAALILVQFAGFLIWLLASDAGVRIGAFVTAVGAHAALLAIAWTRGVPIEPPPREEAVTLNLSSH